MILISDCGSTKADWKLIHPDGQVDSISTQGFNPFFHNSKDIYEILQPAFTEEIDVNKVTKVFHYGTGCSDAGRCKIVADGIQRVCKNAIIEVNHDLLGAARAACGNQEGIVCIIGTGSNTCAYDGTNVIDNVTSLGFLIGDEGSGAILGKMLIKAYYYRELPKDLKTAFEADYTKGEYRSILNAIYDTEHPNVYLASFSPFLSKHKDHIFIQKLVTAAFEEFIKRHIRKYDNHNQLPISFIGSIAYYFQDLLKMVLEERNLKIGTIIKKPINNLVAFHQQEALS